MRSIQGFCCDSGLRRLVPLIFGLPSLSEFGTDIAFYEGETDKCPSFAVNAANRFNRVKCMDTVDTGETNQKRAKGYKGIGMEGPVARWYTKNTAKTLGGFQQRAHEIARHLPEGSRVLEVAPGPGYLAIELAKLGRYQISGLDISRTFVEIAREKARAAAVDVDFQQGDVAHMPYENDTFDFIVCRAAFKNFSNPAGGLNEMYRVLKSGGTALIIDLRRDAPKKTIDQYIDTIGLNWWDTFITKWTVELMLKRRAYLTNEITGLVSQTPFEHLAIEETAMGMEIRLRK